VLCGLWLLRSFLVRDTSGFDSSRVVVAAITFMVLTIVSFAAGQFPWFPSPGAPFPAQVAQLGLFLLSVCLFLAVGQQIDRMTQLRWLTWVFVACGVITCVVQITPSLSNIGRLAMRTGSIGSLFWTWFVAVTVSQGLTNRELRGTARLALLGFGVIALAHGLIQARSWASGWAPPLVAVGAIVVVRWPRLAIGVAALALPVGLLLASQIAPALVDDESYSLATRLEAWRVLWQIAERSPLLGTGLGNYYYYAQNFSILGWYVPFISHNQYQDLLVQTGVLGLLAFAWFGVEALLMSFRLSVQSPPGFPAAYAVGAFGGTVGSLSAGMLGDWIIPFYYNAGVVGFRSSLLLWVFLGGGLALRRMMTASSRVRAVARSLDRAPHPQYGPVPST
jgi:O-antigen ligase